MREAVAGFEVHVLDGVLADVEDEFEFADLVLVERAAFDGGGDGGGFENDVELSCREGWQIERVGATACEAYGGGDEDGDGRCPMVHGRDSVLLWLTLVHYCCSAGLVQWFC